jgi:RNA polymerase sigma-70 factor, ECF subfamily
VDPDRSFERIYRRHRRDVYGSVLRDVRDPDEAEDVTQVAFLNAYRAMRRGDEPEKPRAWLITIARNVVRRRARLRSERPQEVELEAELLVTLDDMEGSAAEDICAALRRLTDAQREAIVLREIQGRSYAEIAETLALSVPAVEALIFRARRALADELSLVDRTPVVRRERGRGLLALPGLAKLGSFGFSFGRMTAACLVGCAVIATVPVGDRDASGEPAAPAAAAQVRHAAVRTPAAAPKMRARHETTKPTKHRTHGTRHSGQSSEGTKQQPGASGGSSGSNTLSVQLPQPLPSIQVPPVTVPAITVPPLPGVQVPPPPDPSDVTLLPPLTS